MGSHQQRSRGHRKDTIGYTHTVVSQFTRRVLQARHNAVSAHRTVRVGTGRVVGTDVVPVLHAAERAGEAGVSRTIAAALVIGYDSQGKGTHAQSAIGVAEGVISGTEPTGHNRI